MEMGNLWAVIVDSGLKSAVLCAGGLLVAGGVMRQTSAARRHVVYAGVLMACLLLPVMSLVLPQWRVLPQWPTAGAPASMQTIGAAAPVQTAALVPQANVTMVPAAPVDTPMVVIPAGPAPEPVRMAWYAAITLQQWLSMAWLAGVLASVMPILLGQIAMLRIRRSARTCDVALVSPRCRMPMACGLLRPVVILPEDAQIWSVARRDAVVRHESEHLRRWDCLWQQLGQLARALYWFNPLIWVVHHRMLCEAERACDDAVLMEGSRPSDYAEHLLAVATTGRSDLLLASAGVAMARSTSLEGRLLSILDAARSRSTVTRGLVCLSIVILVGIAAPLAMLRAQTPLTPTQIESIAAQAIPAVPAEFTKPLRLDSAPEFQVAATRKAALEACRIIASSLIAAFPAPTYNDAAMVDYLEHIREMVGRTEIKRVEFTKERDVLVHVRLSGTAITPLAKQFGWTVPADLPVQIEGTVKAPMTVPATQAATQPSVPDGPLAVLNREQEGEVLSAVKSALPKDCTLLDHTFTPAPQGTRLRLTCITPTDRAIADCMSALQKLSLFRDVTFVSSDRTVHDDKPMRKGVIEATFDPQAFPPAATTSPSAATVGRLEFRIAAGPNAPDDLRISPERMRELLKQLAEQGPEAVGKTAPDLIWVEAEPNENYSIAGDYPSITGDYQRKRYILLSNSPKHTMHNDGTWGLTSVRIVPPSTGGPAVGFDFDQAGAAKFKDLTSSHLMQTVACILDGKVVSAATIRTPLSGSGIVAAQKMDLGQARQIAQALNVGVIARRPVPTAPATAPASQIPFRIVFGDSEVILAKGKPTTWKGLPKVIEADHPEKVPLEMASVSDDIPLHVFRNAQGVLAAIVEKYQLAYLSDTGRASEQETAAYQKAVKDRPAEDGSDGINLTLKATAPLSNVSVYQIQEGDRPVVKWSIDQDSGAVDYLGIIVVPTERPDMGNLASSKLWQMMNIPEKWAWGVMNVRPATQSVVYGQAWPQDPQVKVWHEPEALETGYYMLSIMGYRGPFRQGEGRQPVTRAFAVLKVGNPTEPPKVDYSKLTPEQMQAKVQEWVEDFFTSNYRDITARKTLEWGKAQKLADGNWVIRHKYEAETWRKDKMVQDKQFVFTPEGGFVSVNDVSAAKPAEPTKPVTAADRAKADELAKEGWSLWSRGQPGPAADRFAEAVKLNPNAANSWNGLGWALFNSGRADEALDAFRRCIVLTPNHPAALNGLGQIELGRGDLDAAEKHLLAASPTASAAWWGLAKLYLVQGKYEEAGKWIDRILKEDPRNAEAQKLGLAAREKRLPEELRQLKATSQPHQQ